MTDKQYLVAARKYRPNRFDELVAQEHVTSTLKNALRLDRLAHAYIFSGPRGVGKTTAARILAKAINCSTPLEERDDQAEPCRACESCKSFEAGRSLNVFELDAASNNKVDDIRDLREKVRIPPQGNRRKVYILDEVHMLSKQAFNALLKTLEEPPEHALFIFATTEPHKVLPTILSRCQRFDFRRIPVPEIVSHLRFICEEERISADDASLMLLARKGEGALRDALSAFDQAVSLSGDTLEYSDLAQALGVVDVDLYFNVTTHMSNRDSAGMLMLVQRLMQEGYDLQEFLGGLAEHLRNLTVARAMDDTSLIEASSQVRERYANAAEGLEEKTLLRALMIVDSTEERIRDSRQPRLKLELTLLKMAALGHATELSDTLQQLNRLEQLAKDGKLPAELSGSAKDTRPERDRKSSQGEPPAARDKQPPSSEEETSPVQEPAESSSPPSPGPSSEEEEKEPVATSERPGDAEEPASDEAPSPSSSPNRVREPSPEPASGSDAADDDLGGLFGTPALGGPSAPSDDSGGPKAALQQAVLSGDGGVATLEKAPEDTPAELSRVWPQLVQIVKRNHVSLGAALQQATPLHIDDSTAVIGVANPFYKQTLTEKAPILLEYLQEMTEHSFAEIDVRVRQDLQTEDPAAQEASFDVQQYLKDEAEDDPVLRAIFEQFGGEVVW